jgi:kynurenine formamidase
MCLWETLADIYQKGVKRHDTQISPDESTATNESLLKLPLQTQTVIDLTHTLGTQTPVFPGDQPMRINVAATYDQNGYQDHELHFNEHTGTHLDAPVHFLKDGTAVHEIPVHCLLGPLVVIDIRDRALQNHDATVIPDDLLRWEQNYGRIPNNAIVIMNSGWEKYFTDANAFANLDEQGTPHFPGWSQEAADFLLRERSVIGIGVDTLSLDRGTSKDFPVHHTWLSSGRWGLENVANLAKVPPSGAFLFVGVFKIYGGTGGPVRLIAVA